MRTQTMFFLKSLQESRVLVDIQESLIQKFLLLVGADGQMRTRILVNLINFLLHSNWK